jgi:hypothetical protein
MNINYNTLDTKYFTCLIIRTLDSDQRCVKTNKISLLRMQYSTKHISELVWDMIHILFPSELLGFWTLSLLRNSKY